MTVVDYLAITSRNSTGGPWPASAKLGRGWPQMDADESFRPRLSALVHVLCRFV
jgi:hypothetical protein